MIIVKERLGPFEFSIYIKKNPDSKIYHMYNYITFDIYHEISEEKYNYYKTLSNEYFQEELIKSIENKKIEDEKKQLIELKKQKRMNKKQQASLNFLMSKKEAFEEFASEQAKIIHKYNTLFEEIQAHPSYQGDIDVSLSSIFSLFNLKERIDYDIVYPIKYYIFRILKYFDIKNMDENIYSEKLITYSEYFEINDGNDD